jgi:hypothetical protein
MVYTGLVESSQPGSPANITFHFPPEWTVTRNTSSRISVQNLPGNPGQPQGELARLDIIYQPARPTIGSQQSGDYQVHDVELAGGPGLLIAYTQDAEKFQVLTTIIKHNGAWYIAAGQINLSQPDQTRVENYRNLLLAMFQSIRITP